MVGIAAGVFALMGLAMLMHGIAWLLNDLFFEDDVWIGFMIEAAFWFAVAAAAGFFAYRSVQAGAPPTPDMAIEEARRDQGDAGGWHAVNGSTDIYVSGAGEPVARAAPGAPGRSSEQIRADIERQRSELVPLGRGPSRPSRRAHRLAPPGPRASSRAGDRRRGRRLRDRRLHRTASPLAITPPM